MKKLLLFTGVLAIAGLTSVMAQSGPPVPPDQNGPVAIPVDGGASILLAAGAAYGAKKVKAFKAKKAASKMAVAVAR
jgi:hypothetical protein